MSNVTELETQIQEILEASVSHVVLPPDLVQVVQHRHRRRMGRAAAASAAAVAAIAAMVTLIGLPGRSSPYADHRHANTAHRAPLFPGGGRLLFAGRRGLKWLYPNGSTMRVAGGFSGAQVAGTELVAWNTTGVYIMRLDGARQRLVVEFPPGAASGVPPTGALSPAGSRIAYYTGKTLWAANLATGRRVALGRLTFGGWRDESTIVASATSGGRCC